MPAAEAAQGMISVHRAGSKALEIVKVTHLPGPPTPRFRGFTL